VKIEMDLFIFLISFYIKFYENIFSSSRIASCVQTDLANFTGAPQGRNAHKTSAFLPTQPIRIFLMILRISSDCFLKQHCSVGVCSAEAMFAMR
jgi:hypothetical protein